MSLWGSSFRFAFWVWKLFLSLHVLLAMKWPVHDRVSCRHPMDNQGSLEAILRVYDAEHTAAGGVLLLLS